MRLIATRLLFFAVIAASLPSVRAQTVSFVDMRGERITLRAPVQKVVTLPMPASSMFMSLDGGAQHLAGMHPEARQLMQRTLLARIYPQAMQVRSDITRSGFAPNVETLLQIQPDLIWQWGHMGDDLITPLQQAGLPVAALRYGTEERTREWIRLMGITQGKERQAQAQLQWRTEIEKTVRQATATIAVKDRPKVLYLARRYPQYRVPGKAGNTEYDIALAGGINVSSDVGSSPTVNLEQILAWDPDVILLNNFEARLTPQVIYDDPMLADLAAVRNHRVYKVPAGGYPWDPPSQESPLYWLWLGQVLHPQVFHWPMRELIGQAYRQLYGYAPSQQDLDEVLHVELNRKAQAYERFSR